MPFANFSLHIEILVEAGDAQPTLQAGQQFARSLAAAYLKARNTARGQVPRYPFEFLARGRFTKAVSISRSMLAGLMLRELKSPSEAAVNGLEASATCNKPRKIFGINLHAAIAHPVLVHVETYSLKYQVVCAKTRKQLSTSQRNPLINE